MYVNTFISLEENVPGYGKKKKPSGHVTICSPGIVKCYIQDVDPERGPYIVYLTSKKANKAVRLGEINDPTHAKQTSWKVNADNIQGSNVPAHDVDGVVVAVEGNGIGNTDSVLTGFARDKYLTTSMIEGAMPKKAVKVEPFPPQDIIPGGGPGPVIVPNKGKGPGPVVIPGEGPGPVIVSNKNETPQVQPTGATIGIGTPEQDGEIPGEGLGPAIMPGEGPGPVIEPEPEEGPGPVIEPEPEEGLGPVIEPEPEEGPGPVIEPEDGIGPELEPEEPCNYGFSIKDGKIEEAIVNEIKQMINGDSAKSMPKEELERAILSKVEDFQNKDKLEAKLVQDVADLQAQLQSIMHAGVSELDRAEVEAVEEEVVEKEVDVTDEEVEEVTQEEDTYLQDIEKVLCTIQESMGEQLQKKNKNK